MMGRNILSICDECEVYVFHLRGKEGDLMQKFQNEHSDHEKSTRIVSDYVEEQPEHYEDVTDDLSPSSPLPEQGDFKPTVPDVMPLVKSYRKKEGNSVGGNLHIVLDDGNIEDDHIEWCLNRCLQLGDDDGVALSRLLLKMSKTQRKKISDRFYEEDTHGTK